MTRGGRDGRPRAYGNPPATQLRLWARPAPAIPSGPPGPGLSSTTLRPQEKRAGRVSISGGPERLAWPAAAMAEPPLRDRVRPAPLPSSSARASTSTPAGFARSDPRSRLGSYFGKARFVYLPDASDRRGLPSGRPARPNVRSSRGSRRLPLTRRCCEPARAPALDISTPTIFATAESPSGIRAASQPESLRNVGAIPSLR
jgi:hypothetical protein